MSGFQLAAPSALSKTPPPCPTCRVEVIRVARVDDDRVQHRSVGRAVPSDPRRPVEAHADVVEARDAAPRCRRRPRSGRAPAARCPRTRRPARSRGPAQPEDVIDDAPALRLRAPWGRRAAAPLPSRSGAEIGRAEDRRAQVARARRHQQRAPVARIEHAGGGRAGPGRAARDVPATPRPVRLKIQAPLRVPTRSATAPVAGAGLRASTAIDVSLLQSPTTLLDERAPAKETSPRGARLRDGSSAAFLGPAGSWPQGVPAGNRTGAREPSSRAEEEADVAVGECRISAASGR